MQIPKEILNRIEWERVKKDDTPGYRVIKKVAPLEKPCDDCGKLYTNGRQRVITSKYLIHPVPHWRHHCSQCNLCMDPETKEFTLNSHAVKNAYKNLK